MWVMYDLLSEDKIVWHHIIYLCLYFSNEVCDSNQTYKMCPLCDENIGCPYWFLSDVCIYTRVAYLFDHPATVFYSVFISFWGKV